MCRTAKSGYLSLQTSFKNKSAWGNEHVLPTTHNLPPTTYYLLLTTYTYLLPPTTYNLLKCPYYSNSVRK